MHDLLSQIGGAPRAKPGGDAHQGRARAEEHAEPRAPGETIDRQRRSDEVHQGGGRVDVIDKREIEADPKIAPMNQKR